MGQADLLKRYLDAGLAFTHLTQQRAEDIVRDLVKIGEVKKDQSQKRVEELLERSRQSTDGLVELVQYEVRNQVARLGLVPKSELDAVREELAALKAERAKAGPPAKTASAKKAAKNPVKKAAKKGPSTDSAPPPAEPAPSL